MGDPVRILTHPGGAHMDEFLACAVMTHFHPVEIVRAEPTPDDLDDPRVMVVDVGGAHEPNWGNFDHHQFPADSEPRCALSLVLEHFGLYEDAKRFCSWLEAVEWFDCRGPVDTAKHLGVDRDALHRLHSPVDVTLTRRFAASDIHRPGDSLWNVMQMIGEDLVTFVRGQRERLQFIADNASWWQLPTPEGERDVLFLPRTEPMPSEPSGGLERFIAESGKEQTTIAMVYPDRRGSGYGLSRFNDHPLMDFTQVEACDDVHFAHVRGFVAKTSSTDHARLQELLTLALRGA
ncbi:MYG1 family protein [Sulfuriroseicoccus oceanibius]|uniref:MYG1 family protein n=1 Tax=Sulfuriroseicoccus oceanibius TaxID=2707525 RepID=A0A6B3L9Q4_9BACT|nr:MYG1 family protein [Sulfuriroseicoccus oceanibius]QQL44352.1 MYG1 family protein [Sulfuriroseicoccus oceanibius]